MLNHDDKPMKRLGGRTASPHLAAGLRWFQRRLVLMTVFVWFGCAALADDAPEILWMRGGAGQQITSLDMSANGSLLVSGDIFELVKIWRLPDGVMLRTLEGHSNVVENVALSPDDSLVASIDAGGTLKLWNVQDGTLRWSVTAEFSNLNLVRFAPDGLTIATSGGDKIVRLWRVADGAFIREMAGHSQPVQGIDFSPDGQLLISTAWDRLLQVWRVSDGLLVGTIDNVFRGWSAAFSPDNATVAVGSSRHVRIWRISDGSLVHVLTNHTANVISVRFSADGSTLAAGDVRGAVKLWNVASETAQDIYPESTTAVMTAHPVALSGDATALVFNTPGQSLKLWRSNNPSQLGTISAYNYFARSVSFSPDGRLLATAGAGERVHVFRTADGSPDPILEDVSPTIGRVVAFSPDGTLLAGGDNSGQITLWRVNDGQLVRQIPAHAASPESIVALAFSPDSTLIASGGADAVAKIWHVADGSPLRSLSGHSLNIYTLAFSPQGDLLVSGSGDTTLKLWRVADGNLNYTLTNHTDLVVSAAFSPDGTTLASGCFDGTARLWNVTDGSNVGTLQDGFAVRGLAYTSDGNHLFTAGAAAFPGLRGTLRIWHLPDGTNVQTFSRELAFPTTLRVSSDQRFIAYGRYDGTVVLAKNPLAPPLGPQLSLQRSAPEWLLRVTGISGTNLTMQTSSNLVDWSDANQFPNPPNTLDLPLTLDSSRRFYRALQR